jgi:hypothetical protein
MTNFQAKHEIGAHMRRAASALAILTYLSLGDWFHMETQK